MSTNGNYRATFNLPVTVTWDSEYGRWFAIVDFSHIGDALTHLPDDADVNDILRGLRVMQAADLHARCGAPVTFVSRNTQAMWAQVTL